MLKHEGIHKHTMLQIGSHTERGHILYDSTLFSSKAR